MKSFPLPVDVAAEVCVKADMPTPEDRSVVTVPPFLALKGQLDGLSPEGRLYRIHELNPQERSLSLCCAESYEIVHRNLIGLKSLPSLLYTGQLVTLDEENKAISNAVFQCDRKAVRTSKPWTGTLRILVYHQNGVLNRSSLEESSLNESSLEGSSLNNISNSVCVLRRLAEESKAHHLVVFEDPVNPSLSLGRSLACSGQLRSSCPITVLNHAACRLLVNDAELPILFSPKPPHSLSSAAGNRERVLEDLLSQGSVLPGAWMAGVYSVHPADLASYALKPTDLWIVTPEPNNLPSSPTAVSTAPMSATPTWSQGHYLWLSVPNLSCIDIGAGGPLFRNNVVIS